MIHSQKNFLLQIENIKSPIIFTVPHGGMKDSYGSWLNFLLKRRTLSEIPEKNVIKGEKIILGGDGAITHVTADVLAEYPANAIIGLLPRCFVDYNRFVPEVAYADEKAKPFYEAYHQAISKTIEKLKKSWSQLALFDLHGFGKQPLNDWEFDIILGTNGESSPNGFDKFFYNSLKSKYKIFCAGQAGMPLNESPLYCGDTTNLFYYKKYQLDGVLVEIAPKFRKEKSLGRELSHNLALTFSELAKKIN